MKIQNNNLEIYFVVKDGYKNENEVSDDMQLAFMNIVDWRLCPKWARQNDLSNISNEKGNIFVFEEFSDNFIKSFRETHPNARVLGPRCLLTCIMDNTHIPNIPSPVFNMAMNKLVICTAKLSPDEKKEIEKLVGYMGGKFTNPLTSSTTHLIVSSVLSQRYFIAIEKGMSIMKRGWVQEVWQLNAKDNVKATDYDITKTYSCPIFYNLKVTSSSVTPEEKAIIKEKIENNGGVYSPDLQRLITILITPIANGDKFRYARRWGIPCVQPDWIDDCLRKGHVVPLENYIVRNSKEISSTPVPKPLPQKPISLIDTNESELSIIPSNTERSTVNDSEPKVQNLTIERCLNLKETVNDSESKVENLTIQRSLNSKEASQFKTPTKTCPRRNDTSKVSLCDISLENNSSYKKILDEIDLKTLKQCGPIFDGCKLYLSGFNANEEEKLRKILNYGGALRFAELNESITHIVVGNPTNADIQRIQSIPNRPHVVKLDWLSNSIKQKSLAKEATCAFFQDDKVEVQCNPVSQQPSPLSKKGYQILNPGSLEKESPRIPVVDMNLLERYSQSSQDYAEDNRPEPIPAASEAAPSQQQSAPSTNTLFAGLQFAIIGHNAEATEAFKKTVLEYGGSVVTNNRAIVDFAIVPIVYSQTKTTANEIVSLIWLEDCFLNMKVMDVKYYHLPITTSHLTTKPLANCVVTLSSYYLLERQYLENLLKLLGANCQDILAKKVNPSAKIYQTTHLVCASPQGAKYDAAKKWNLPIVTEMWIRECFKNNEKLPVEDYLTMFVKNSDTTDAKSVSKKIETRQIAPDPCSSRSRPTQNDVSEIPNFCAAASSTKIGDSKLRSSQRNVINEAPDFGAAASLNKINDSKRPSQRTLTNEVPNFCAVASSTKIGDSKSHPTQQKIINEELPNFCAVATSTKIGDVLRDEIKLSQSSSGRLTRRSSRSSQVGSQTNGVCSAISYKAGCSAENKNKADECSKSKSVTGPTGLILEMNASCGRSTSLAKRKSRDDSNDRKQRSPKKKAFNRDKHTLTPVEEIGWQDTLTDLSHQLDSGPSSSPSTNPENPPNPEPSQKRQLPQPKSIPPKKSPPLPVVRHNIMISLDIERTEALKEQLTIVGGCYVNAYEPENDESSRATHLVIDELKKTEKVLCAIAAGLWILHSSYLEDSIKRKEFLKEEDYEWGNPKNDRFLQNANQEVKLLAAAAHRWRLVILKGGLDKRPFIDMKAVIPSPNIDGTVLSLTRVIKAGGGKVLQSKDTLKCTHCLLKNLNCVEHITVPLEVMAKNRIHCLHAVYLRDFLIYHPPPDPRLRYIPEYQRYFK